MRLAGEPYAPASPSEATARGVAFVHQELNLFPNLSVAENVFLHALPRRGPLVDRARLESRTRHLLGEVGLDVPPATLVEDLAPGERQLVEIVKALAVEARVVILDEPTTSLSAPEAERLFAIVGRLRAQGLGVIYVSHALGDVLRLADDVLVLRDGAVVGQGPRAGFDEARLVSLMVGREIETVFPARRAAPTGEVALEARGASSGGRLAGPAVHPAPRRGGRPRGPHGRRANRGAAGPLRSRYAGGRRGAGGGAEAGAVAARRDRPRPGVRDRGPPTGRPPAGRVGRRQPRARGPSVPGLARPRASGARPRGGGRPGGGRPAGVGHRPFRAGAQPLRRQPAEGRPRQVADGEARRLPAGRAHPRDRRRGEAAGLPADRRSRRLRGGRARRLLRDRGAAGAVRPHPGDAPRGDRGPLRAAGPGPREGETAGFDREAILRAALGASAPARLEARP